MKRKERKEGNHAGALQLWKKKNYPASKGQKN
jgi:hypothetical protein